MKRVEESEESHVDIYLIFYYRYYSHLAINYHTFLFFAWLASNEWSCKNLQEYKGLHINNFWQEVFTQ